MANLPPSVYAEAKRLVDLPTGMCDKGCAKTLVIALRKSELRKQRAIIAAIASHARNARYLKTRGKTNRKAT